MGADEDDIPPGPRQKERMRRQARIAENIDCLVHAVATGRLSALYAIDRYRGQWRVSRGERTVDYYPGTGAVVDTSVQPNRRLGNMSGAELLVMLEDS